MICLGHMESKFVAQGQAYIITEEGIVVFPRVPDGWPPGVVGGVGGVDRERETQAVRDDITTPTIFFYYSPTPHSNHPNHPK